MLYLWIALMLAIWIMRTAGIPAFGEPRLDAARQRQIDAEIPLTVEGVIAERRAREESTQYLLRDVHIRGDRPISFSGLLLNTETEEPFPIGSEIRLSGDVSRIEPAGNPGQFDPQNYYRNRRIYYRVWSNRITQIRPGCGLREALANLRERLVRALQGAMPERAAAVLAGMLLGERSLLEEDTTRNYQVGGLFHIIAISGMHISLLGMSLFKALCRLRMKLSLAALLSVAIMAVYCVMIGSPISAVRACVMFAVSLLARVLKRTYDLWSSLAFAGILLLLRNPGNLFMAAYQLSFAAVVGTGYVGPHLERIVCERKPNRFILQYLLRPALTYLAVTITTLPMIAIHYFEIPLLGLVCNLVVVPAVGLILGVGAAGAATSLLTPAGGTVILWPIGKLLQLIDWSLSMIRQIPFASYVCGRPTLWQAAVYYFLIGALLVGVGKWNSRALRIRQATCLVGAVLILFAHQFPWVQTIREAGCPVTLTAIDVGQGDALVLHRAGGITCLIDGGSSSQKEPGRYCILPYLRHQGIGRIDAIFLSHPDLDHMNGIEEILCAVRDRTTAIRVGALMMPSWMRTEENGKALEQLAGSAGVTVRYIGAGDQFRSGDLTIEVLFPPPDENGADLWGNAGSEVLWVRYGAFDALLTGDLEGEGEDQITKKIKPVECLKVAHHGSKNSTFQPFLEACDPAVALISAGKNNVYGHPHAETISRLTKAGARILRTSEHGAITVATDGTNMHIHAWRGA